MAAAVPNRVREAEPFSGYAPDANRPLGPYALLATVFNVLAVAFLLVVRRSRGRELPERYEAGDVVLLTVATHKISRLVAKDRVTAFARAPFTEYQDSAGHGEVEEKPRGTGLRKAIGELLVCPYCLGLWVATILAAGLVVAPRTTRFVATVFTALTGADFLQLAYRGAADRV